MKVKGIYKIENTRTGMVYIGSSIRISERWVDHQSQLNRGIHHCSALQDEWNVFGSEYFTHEVLELTSELEARESHWMEQYQGKLLNSTDVTHNPMRNQESVDKMLATRGSKQTGANSSSAKFSEDRYLQIVYALGTTTYSPEDLSDYFGLSPRSIRDIIKGSRHAWIQERFPEAFSTMQKWRKNLRIFRATDTLPPEIELPIDTTFTNELHSYRRDYGFRSDAEARARSLERKEREVGGRQLRALTAEEEAKKGWIHLVNKEGEELKLIQPEEAEKFGLKVSFLQELKAKKLIRYKGWRLKK